MRVNIYAEEMTQKVEIVEKKIDGQIFIGVRFYLELPVSKYRGALLDHEGKGLVPDIKTPSSTHESDVVQLRGAFIHRPGDDDSAAVTFWGKKDLRHVLEKAIELLDKHHEEKI